MSEEEQSGDDEFIEFKAFMPAPNPIMLPKPEEEAELIASWIDAAHEDGVLAEHEQVSASNLRAVARMAVRKELTTLNLDDATLLLVWVTAFHAGVSFEQHKHQIMAAQAMMGLAGHMMGIDPNTITENILEVMKEEGHEIVDDDE